MTERRYKRGTVVGGAELVIIGIVIGVVGAMLLFSYGDFSKPMLSDAGSGRAVAKIAAVTSSGNGIVGEVEVEMIDGSGRILITTTPFAEFDTQQSVEAAARAAEAVTGRSLENKDLLVSFRISSSSNSPEVIGGPSAGISIATAIVAAMENLTVRDDVVLTGTIDESGSVGRVGGIAEKARAAADAGAKLFIAPRGSGDIEFYSKEVRTRKMGRFVVQIVDYVPKITTLDEYVEQFGINAAEVSSLKEALPHTIIEEERVQDLLSFRIAGFAGAEPVKASAENAAYGDCGYA
ncbi:MAG: hypothetical protein HYW25_03980 [Candidatus Aenigmarchaeota archaeon]|nr:hypothetical protein [Candidatus Aenigmarchaeota archaeon]